MSFYPTNSTSGYVYTSSDGTITRHDTTLDKMPPGSMNITASNEVMNRLPAAVSLITVDWVNDMLYWLEVNDTHAAVSVCVCLCVCVCACVWLYICMHMCMCIRVTTFMYNTCVIMCMCVCVHACTCVYV